MTSSVFSNLGFMCSLNFILLVLTGRSLSSPISSTVSHHRASASRDVGDHSLFDAQDFLSQILSTLNLTEVGPKPRPLTARKEPPEYMLELYNRFANDHTSVPSSNIVRSFKNEDSSPYSLTTRGVRIFPLLFNISMPHYEHITAAELRLFTLVQKAQRPFPGLDCKVTIYKIHEGVVWTEEVGKEGRRRNKEKVAQTMDLEELMTTHIRAKHNNWVSFDLTHVVTLWQKSGCATHRLEVHVAGLVSVEEGEATQEVREESKNLVEIDIDRSTDGKQNAVMIVFSDDQSKDHKEDKKELTQRIERENDLPGNMGRSQQTFWGHLNHKTGHANQDDLDKQSLVQLQSNLIYDTPPRIRRNVKSAPCKRTPLFVDFKDIGWDTWIIQPLGYEAYECNGVCSPPMTSEVSPTKHAIVQTLLSVKSPERASRACCVPTKLEPISLLYHDNGVITFNHKYEGMVVAECGCR
ncbi:bone morphogenetic protein 10-like [Solea senegalensis]|uniref:Bone morphogenetic protein 10-like n=1 Tax=Solea senegalensis TaxID=28829 RepID=A0AAV6R1G6_SOLSE|nr:bone morphogenetic protein 10-like [Solea senegalensis]KAG7498730.1 bone morphogenetic protein 10-like [Solea senegalensis]